jgi:serine-type D-Ala-D-Ala endopeptidase (penicillin-binding protein 7)
MSWMVRRFAPLLLLSLLIAAPPAETATRKSSGKTLQTTRAKGKKSKRSRGRRARRLPPGQVVWARHAVVLDPVTNEILFEKNASASVPIASLSKLMTGIVFIEQNPDLSRPVAVTRQEIRGGGHTQLWNQELVSLGDLLHMSLMCSDNVATRVLARESGLSRDDFLARMNRKAVDLGLARTRFVEFTGLDERNVSTATDCARLLKAAAAYPTLQDIMTTRHHQFLSAYKTRTRSHAVVNTNRLLVYGSMDIRGGKTGFIMEAGYCFVTWIHTQSRDLIAVVLGAPTAATRFADVQRLVAKTSTQPRTSSLPMQSVEAGTH